MIARTYSATLLGVNAATASEKAVVLCSGGAHEGWVAWHPLFLNERMTRGRL